MSTLTGDFGGVVALPKAQLDALFANGSVTYDGVTYVYDPFTLYACPENEQWQRPVASTSVSSGGLISYLDSGGAALFTVQLPLYNGGVT